MPFDNTAAAPVVTTTKPVRNTLAAIGLTPVPRALAEAHKEHVIKQFCDGEPYHELMVQYNTVFWRSVPIRHARNLEERPGFSTEKFAAPRQVVELFKEVKTNIRDASFTMEYFYTDPILNIHYTDAAGNPHMDCLAVWDNGIVIAAAEGTLKPRWRFGALEFVLSAIAVLSLASPLMW